MGRHLVASGRCRPTAQSAVVLSPDAVIPDTAEWCYPAQAAKRCPRCPDTVGMTSVAIGASGLQGVPGPRPVAPVADPQGEQDDQGAQPGRASQGRERPARSWPDRDHVGPVLPCDGEAAGGHGCGHFRPAPAGSSVCWFRTPDRHRLPRPDEAVVFDRPEGACWPWTSMAGQSGPGQRQRPDLRHRPPPPAPPSWSWVSSPS
jgi:hypothetical protein